MRHVYNKLVRDRVPEIVRSQGHQPITHVLDNDQYQAVLLAKLLKEAQEAQSAPAEDLLSELAAVLEVLQALIAAPKHELSRTPHRGSPQTCPARCLC